MKKLILSALLLCMAHLATSAQSGTPFIGNVVRFTRTNDLYGFVLYKDGTDHVLMTVKNKDRFEEEEYVAFNKQEEVKATLLKERIRIGDYYVGLYRVRTSSDASKKHFTVTEAGKEYATYKNAYAEDVRMVDLHIDRHARPTRAEDANDPTTEPVTFTVRGKQTVKPGMPLIDEEGNVAAIVASLANSNTGSFVALDMYPIYKKLVDAGALAGDKCMYFNLLQKHYTETVCQKEAREAREAAAEAKRRAKDEARRLGQLEQMRIDSLYRAGDRTSIVVKRHRQNRDYAIALGPTLNGNVNIYALQIASGDGVKAGLPRNDTPVAGGGTRFGYTLGMNIYLKPDAGKTRLVLMPRIAENKFGFTANYGAITGEATGRRMLFYKAKSYEMGVMADFVTKRLVDGDNFVCLGYIYGMHYQAAYGYKGADSFVVSEYKQKFVQEVSSYPQSSHKVILGYGVASKHTRILFHLSYQFAAMAPENYTLIYNAQQVKPFYFMGNGYFSIGVELSYRLWGQWRNDYRTMFGG